MSRITREYEMDQSRLDTLIQLQSQSLKDSDVDIIYKAFKGSGKKDKLLINSLCSRSKAGLYDIDLQFRDTYEKSLLDMISSETSGEYRNFLSLMVQPTDECDALIIHNACSGMGTDEALLIEVLGGRNSEEIAAMRRRYDSRFERSLLDTIRKEVSGNLQEMLLTLAKEPRDDGSPDMVDLAKAEQDADLLYSGAKGWNSPGWGADKQAMIDILTKQPREQIQAVMVAYENRHNASIQNTIESELSGSTAEAMKAMLWRNKFAFLASKLHKAMRGVGTDEATVARILGGHDKYQVRRIADEYHLMYQNRLVDDLRRELSGDLRDATITWLMANDPLGVSLGISYGPVDKAVALGNALAERDADQIFLACKGWSTDDDAIVNVICRRNKAQIQRIDNKFYEKYGKSLSAEINKQCSGDFRKVVKYIAMPLYAFDAYMLKKACQGFGTDEQLLIDVLSTRSNDRLFQAKQHYERNTGKALIDRLLGDVSSGLRTFVTKRLQCDRNEEEQPDQQLATHQAALLASINNEDEAINILASNSVSQIQAIKMAFESSQRKSLAQDIKDKYSGLSSRAMLALLEDPIDHHCVRLQNSFKTFGNDDSTIARTLGGLDKSDVIRVANRYQQMYDRRLPDVLEKELSGSFRHACVAWVIEPEHTNGLEDSVMTLETDTREYGDEDIDDDEHLPATTTERLSKEQTGQMPGEVIRTREIPQRNISNPAEEKSRDVLIPESVSMSNVGSLHEQKQPLQTLPQPPLPARASHQHQRSQAIEKDKVTQEPITAPQVSFGEVSSIQPTTCPSTTILDEEKLLKEQELRERHLMQDLTEMRLVDMELGKVSQRPVTELDQRPLQQSTTPIQSVQPFKQSQEGEDDYYIQPFFKKLSQSDSQETYQELVPGSRLVVERATEDRVTFSGGPVRTAEGFPAKMYLGMTVPSKVTQAVKVTVTAADQGWGDEGRSLVRLVVLDKNRRLKASQKIGYATHRPTEFHTEADKLFLSNMSKGDRLEMWLVSAPWKGWACRGISGRIEYISA